MPYFPGIDLGAALNFGNDVMLGFRLLSCKRRPDVREITSRLSSLLSNLFILA